MEVLLYPYHALMPYDITVGTPSPRLAAIAATLLYFDRVTLGRVGYAEELSLPDCDDLYEQAKRIEEKRGKDTVKTWWTNGQHEGLSLGDIATLAHLKYTYYDHKFLQSYAPLLKEGLLDIASLATITRQARSSAEAVGSDKAKYLDMKYNLIGFRADRDAFTGWPRNDEDMKVFEEAYHDADGTDFMCAYVQQIISPSSPNELEKMDAETLSMFWREAFLMDVFHQTTLSHILNLPIVSLSEAHLTLRTRYAARLQKSHRSEPTAQSKEALATQLFAETLIQVPTVIPKSCEALLETRRRLADELQSFRDAANDAAEDLLSAGDGKVETSKVAQTIRQKFTRPLRDLERKLAHPNRDLIRNLVSNASFITGGVTFASAALLGAAQMSAALLGVSIPLLTQSLKTLFDRKAEISCPCEKSLNRETVSLVY